MAINIDYQPAMQVMANAAWLMGRGEYMQRQQDDFLKARQIDQQYQLAQDQLAARLAIEQQNRLDKQTSLLFRDAQRDAAQQQQQANAIEREQLKSQLKADTGALARQRHLEDAARKEGEAEIDRIFGYERASAHDEFKSVDSYLTDLSKKRDWMDDVTKVQFDKVRQDFLAINRLSDEMSLKERRPEVYLKTLGEFKKNLIKAGFENKLQEPKSFSALVAEASEKEPVYAIGPPGPDGQPTKGEFMGWSIWTNQVRNGVTVPTSRFIPYKPDKGAAVSEPKGTGFRDWLTENRKLYVGVPAKDLAAIYLEESRAIDLLEEEQLSASQMPRAGQRPPDMHQPPANVPAPPSIPPAPANPPQSSVPTSGRLIRPRDGREALTLVREAQTERDGEPRFPDPAKLPEQQVSQYVNSPAARRIMAEQGIVNPTVPPAPPPPMITPDSQGETQLRSLLQANPQGVVVIDARDGKRKFISAEMLGK